LYFSDHRALAWTIFTVAAYAGTFVHEFGHLIAARAVGVNARMGISHRLWYLVAETDLTALWAVPKRQRYFPMLAGMLLDAVSTAFLILLLFAQRSGWLSFSSFNVHLVRAVALVYLMRIVWQFFLFVRTDLYYVIATAFNCRNLLGDTSHYLRNLAARIIPSIDLVDQSGIPASELRMVRAYSLLWIAGRIWAVLVLVVVTLPVSFSYLRDLTAAFRLGYSANPGNFADALVVATYVLAPLIAGFVLWIGGMVRRERIS